MSGEIPATARDAGLVAGIGSFALTGSFIGILVGAGIYNVPASMAAAVGDKAWMAYLGCGAAMALIMVCFAEASARVPTSGGPYGFVAAAFGPYAGWLAGSLNWLSAVLAVGGVAAAAADTIATLVPAMATGPIRIAAIIGWFALLAAINIAGVGRAARFVAATTLIKLVPMALFLIIGAANMKAGNFHLADAASHSDVGRAAILGFFLFTGIESVLAVNGEVRDPARTIPRAILATLIVVALLYLGVQQVAQGLLGAGLATAKAPLVEAAAMVSPGLARLLVAGALASMLGWMASDALASPRSLFAFARDGFLPAVLGRVHPRSHAPHVAIIVHGGIAALLAVTGSFAALAILSTLFVVVVYLLGCAAAVKLRRDGVALAGPVRMLPGLPLYAAGAFVALGWLALQSSRAEALAIGGAVVLFSLMYPLRRRSQAPASA